MISKKLSQLLKVRNSSNSGRITAVATGVLLILGMVAGVLSVVPAVDSTKYLIEAHANEGQVIKGAFFQLMMIVPYVGIPVVLYPILSRYNKGMAIGSVASGIMSGVFIILGVIVLLTLLTLSQAFIQTENSDILYFETLGDMMRIGRDLVNHLAMTLAFCMSLLLINLIFFQTRLIPRLLSGLGIVGALLSIAASVLFMIGMIGLDGIYMSLNAPIALQEIVLAIWLVVKGFGNVPEDYIAKV